MIRLPIPFRRPPHALWYTLLWAPYVAAYQLSNRFPLAEPRELPMTSLDLAIPFVPTMLPVYISYIPFYWWTVATARDDAELGRLFYGTHLQMALCLPLFLLMPIRMPRERFYGAEIYGWADVFWRWFDGPNNCLPSLHTANCLFLSHVFAMRVTSRWAKGSHGAIAMAIVVSTVLVKQHYVVDLVAGALLYLVTASALARVTIQE